MGVSLAFVVLHIFCFCFCCASCNIQFYTVIIQMSITYVISEPEVKLHYIFYNKKGMPCSYVIQMFFMTARQYILHNENILRSVTLVVSPVGMPLVKIYRHEIVSWNWLQIITFAAETLKYTQQQCKYCPSYCHRIRMSNISVLIKDIWLVIHVIFYHGFNPVGINRLHKWKYFHCRIVG